MINFQLFTKIYFCELHIDHSNIDHIYSGGLAQLARALDLHSRGQGFDSLILHFFFTRVVF